jgi:hypothetical protein
MTRFTSQAMVRMDRHIPYDKRMARVEEVIQEVSIHIIMKHVYGVLLSLYFHNLAVAGKMQKHYHRSFREVKRFIRR